MSGWKVGYTDSGGRKSTAYVPAPEDEDFDFDFGDVVEATNKHTDLPVTLKLTEEGWVVTGCDHAFFVIGSIYTSNDWECRNCGKAATA